MIVHVYGALLRFTDYRRVITVDAPTVETALTRYMPPGRLILRPDFLNGTGAGRMVEPHERHRIAGPRPQFRRSRLGDSRPRRHICRAITDLNQGGTTR